MEFRPAEQPDFTFSLSSSEDEDPKHRRRRLKSEITSPIHEIGETSVAAIDNASIKLTRAQRRNRNKRLKRQEERQLREKKQKSVDDRRITFPIPQNSPVKLPFENIRQYEKDIDILQMASLELMPRARAIKTQLSKQEERRILKIDRKYFEQYNHVAGKTINILEGIKLFNGIFDEADQEAILAHVEAAREMGQAGLLRKRTYTEPSKWIRGKGRITIQYGCCYNYARDYEGNPPGILRHEKVDHMPIFIVQIIKRLVTWGIVPADCIPDSCIINIYDKGDCIPPHIDSHDFERTFCTVSLMSRCSLILGREIQILGPGEFQGTYDISLARGSVLLLQGNGANVVKHCIPSVTRPRVSITLRRIKPDKRPIGYWANPELEGLKPFQLP